MYAFHIFGKDTPSLCKKIFFGSFYPLIHLLWEGRYVPVLFLVLSVTLKVLWKVTQRCPHALTGHTHTLVRAGSGAPRSRSSSTTWSWPLRAAQCSGVSPSLKQKERKQMSTSPAVHPGTLGNNLPGMQPHRCEKAPFLTPN